MATYTPEDRARAIGALYASAEEIEGELVPNFHATGKRIGIAHNVLMTWWDDRDLSGDRQILTALSRARAKAAETEAFKWYRDLLDNVRARAEEIAVRTDWADCDAADASRGIKALTEALDKFPSLYGMKTNVDAPGDGNAGGDSGAVDGGVRRALERSRSRRP